jgi:hypothetical protein
MIFESDDDRRTFLSVFDEVCETLNWECHGLLLNGQSPPFFDRNYQQGPSALNRDWILSAFGERREAAITGYERFVAEGKSQPSPRENLKNQIYLGSDQFVDDMQRRIERPDLPSEIPSSQRRSSAKSLQHYADVASSRNEAIVLSHSSGGYGMKEIGDFFGLHYSRISRIIREAKRKT